MMWHEKTKQFVYQGRIVSCPSDARRLNHFRKLSVFALPVPNGRIVEFSRDDHDALGRKALYKVNVTLKPEVLI